MAYYILNSGTAAENATSEVRDGRFRGTQ